MRSFGFFSAVAAIACSVFVAAAPFDAVHARAPVALDLPKVEARCATCSDTSSGLTTVIAVLNTVRTSIEPTCSQLKGMDAGSASPATITPPLSSIVENLRIAVSALEALGADVIFATDEELSVVAALLGDILCLVLGALRNVLNFVTADVLGAVFVEVGTLLGSLLGCLISLVGAGLLVPLFPLIESVVSVIGICDFTSLASALNL